MKKYKIRVEETVLKQHAKYKGGIRWVKLKIGDSVYKVEKRRAFGWDAKQITANEYNWIDTPQKAQAMWDFVHMHGTAMWFGGELAHPITGEIYQNQGANMPRPIA